MPQVVVIVSLLAGTVYFVMHNHPWWALLFVVLAASVRATGERVDEE